MLNKQLENCADFCMLVWLPVCLYVMMYYVAVLFLDLYPEYHIGQNILNSILVHNLQIVILIKVFLFIKSNTMYIVVIMHTFIKI